MKRRTFTTHMTAAVSVVCALLILMLIGTDTVFAAKKTTNINSDKAIALALSDAGVDSASAKNLHYETDYEKGVLVYDVEFEADGKEYEYELRASDGKIMEKSVKKISLAKAKKNATVSATLKQLKSVANKAASKQKETKANTTSASKSTTKKTTSSSSASKTTSASKSSGTTSKTKTSTSSGSYIGVDKAKSIALKHAGKSASSVSFTKAKLDKDDGKVVYEIEFRSGRTEYEYDIDAYSGKILEYDIDRD